MPSIKDSTLNGPVEDLGYTRLPPEQQNLNVPPPNFESSFSSSPGNPAPLRSLLPLNITPDMYVRRYYPDAPHFERSFPISIVTAQYNAAQALTMQAASVSSSEPLIQPQNLDQLPDGDIHASPLQTALLRGQVDLSKPGVISKTLGNIADSANRKAATAANLSYRPLSNPLTATDAGVTATVTIASFSMRVAGIGDIAVTGGTIATLAFSTLYFIYYDDPNFAGGTVTHNATTIKENGLNNAGRFFVGSILTPADGAADTVGNNDGGAGAQSGSRFSCLATQYNDFDPATVTDPTKALDGMLSTFAGLSAIAGSPARLDIFGYPNSPFPPSQIKLTIYSSHTHTGVGTSTGIIRYSKDGGGTWTDVRNSTSDWDASATPDEVVITGVPVAVIVVQAYAHQLNAGTSVVKLYEAPAVVTS
jgi:hypothetical protein